MVSVFQQGSTFAETGTHRAEGPSGARPKTVMIGADAHDRRAASRRPTRPSSGRENPIEAAWKGRGNGPRWRRGRAESHEGISPTAAGSSEGDEAPDVAPGPRATDGPCRRCRELRTERV